MPDAMHVAEHNTQSAKYGLATRCDAAALLAERLHKHLSISQQKTIMRITAASYSTPPERH
jgi:hypothetical protein